MHHLLFDYIFRQKNIAKPNQPISLFTSSGNYVIGRYLSCYTDIHGEKPIAKLIEVQLNALDKNVYRPDDILKLKITFKDDPVDHKGDYSLFEILDHLELSQIAEIELKTKEVRNGYIFSYPNIAGAFEMEIDLLTSEGLACIDFGDMETFSLVFDQYSYLDEILPVK